MCHLAKGLVNLMEDTVPHTRCYPLFYRLPGVHMKQKSLCAPLMCSQLLNRGRKCFGFLSRLLQDIKQWPNMLTLSKGNVANWPKVIHLMKLQLDRRLFFRRVLQDRHNSQLIYRKYSNDAFVAQVVIWRSRNGHALAFLLLTSIAWTSFSALLPVS